MAEGQDQGDQKPKTRDYLVLNDKLASRTDLTASQKLIIATISRLQGYKSCCWPSYATIARITGLQKRQVMRDIKRLQEQREVRIIRRSNESRDKRYTTNLFWVPDVSKRNIRRKWAEVRAAEKAKKEAEAKNQTQPGSDTMSLCA